MPGGLSWAAHGIFIRREKFIVDGLWRRALALHYVADDVALRRVVVEKRVFTDAILIHRDAEGEQIRSDIELFRRQRYLLGR